MLRLNDAQRTVLVQAFPAVAHLAVGGLVFGQFLSEQPYSVPLALIAVVGWLVCVSLAVIIAKGERP